MPKGGSENLIALPLQQEPRKRDNTVFLDDSLEPISDQWNYLAGLSRVTLGEVESIAREGERQGRIIGVRISETDDDENARPWRRPPARVSRRKITGILPAEISATLARRLFVDKQGLPSPLMSEIGLRRWKRRRRGYRTLDHTETDSSLMTTGTLPAESSIE